MKEKYNFKIDSSNKSISIEVSPVIFPIPAILYAAYHFIESGKVIVEKGNEERVVVTLIPNQELKEPELEKLAYEFNIQLISSFVEEEESKKHVGVRDTLMKAALFPQTQNFFQRKPSSSDEPSQPEKNCSKV